MHFTSESEFHLTWIVSDLLEVPVGLMTRLRAKRYEKAKMDFFKMHGLRWTLRS